jgi:hypothetical protein
MKMSQVETKKFPYNFFSDSNPKPIVAARRRDNQLDSKHAIPATHGRLICQHPAATSIAP